MGNDDYNVSEINVIDLRKESLTEALLEIEKRPSLWLYENNAACLKSFINGWIVGRNEKSDELLLDDFDTFIANEFDMGASTLGWCVHIIDYCGGKESLAVFYKLFHKYMETRPQ